MAEKSRSGNKQQLILTPLEETRVIVRSQEKTEFNAFAGPKSVGTVELRISVKLNEEIRTPEDVGKLIRDAGFGVKLRKKELERLLRGQKITIVH